MPDRARAILNLRPHSLGDGRLRRVQMGVETASKMRSALPKMR
jgi:hypothetical protein